MLLAVCGLSASLWVSIDCLVFCDGGAVRPLHAHAVAPGQSPLASSRGDTRTSHQGGLGQCPLRDGKASVRETLSAPSSVKVCSSIKKTHFFSRFDFRKYTFDMENRECNF